LASRHQKGKKKELEEANLLLLLAETTLGVVGLHGRRSTLEREAKGSSSKGGTGRVNSSNSSMPIFSDRCLWLLKVTSWH
jgi:hypothetical protein